jgi:hypothetical protein
MSHATPSSGAVALLSAGVVASAKRAFLISLGSGPDRFRPADDGAEHGAESLPPVAAGADLDLLAAEPALEDSVTLGDGRR